jgi:hypothetical protein
MEIICPPAGSSLSFIYDSLRIAGPSCTSKSPTGSEQLPFALLDAYVLWYIRERPNGFLRGNYCITQMFAHFTKTINDLQY